MKRIIYFLWGLALLCLASNSTLNAQQYSGEVFFNQGSTAGALSPEYQSSLTVGQSSAGVNFGVDHQGGLGFWSRYLLPPTAPILTATEGDFPDRILIEWRVDALSPVSDLGFNIYRDGAFLAHLEPGTLQFIDFNVIPGIFYNYEVKGINVYGEGYTNGAVGFVNPNGKVTGQVKTINNNPVAGVQVTLEPTIGKALSFDGQDDFVEIPYNPVITNSELTFSSWVKMGDDYALDGVFDVGRILNKNWFISTTDKATHGKGLTFGMGVSGNIYENVTVLFDTLPDAWHHVAFTYNGLTQNIYLDGVLKVSRTITMEVSPAPLFIGKLGGYSDKVFDGKLDDIRIYNRQLSQTEITRTMNATVPSNAEGLAAYWKLDEGIGYKVFDLAENQLDGIISGANFSDDRPEILNAGVTDESGYYLIDGINYGGGQSFVARPSKNFEYNNGLEFNASNNDFATITDFTPRDTGTIELWVKPSTLTGTQTILTNGSNFELYLTGADLKLNLDGSVKHIGTISNTEYTHVALSYQPNGSPNLSTFVNGVNNLNYSVSPITWNSTWILGRNVAGGNYYTGLIDEVVFYNKMRTQSEIQQNASATTNGVDITDLNLSAFFSLNESIGTSFQDQSPNNTGTGTIHGATWTNVTARPETVPHEFNPSSRIVSLDGNITSSDDVDFTDLSTVSVSGYVRYAGTQCFAQNVELLVDGQSMVPPIYTNEEGYFVGDFEPGSSFSLSPKLAGHSFIPAFWEINNIVVPKSGIVFNDQTKRDVEGLLAGGLCEKSIVGETDSVMVKLTSTNGCYEKFYKVAAGTTSFDFEKVPPIQYTLSVVHHSDATIKNYFNDLGGVSFNLMNGDTALQFIYRSPIAIETSTFDTLACSSYPLLEQFKRYFVDVKVYELYNQERCYLDSVSLVFDNVVSGGGANVDTSFTGETYRHYFNVGSPNITAPYTKTISITAKDPFAENRIATEIMSLVVTGKRKRPTQFATTSPEIPWLILRDPPGDQSFSYWESGKKQCTHVSNSIQEDDSHDVMTTVSTGAQFEVGGLFWSTETEITANTSFGFQASRSFTSNTEQKLCLTATTQISTDDGDVIVGGDMGGDVYVGGAMNLVFGIADVLLFDTNSCAFQLDTTLVISQNGFATQYLYSEYHIKNVVIPSLELINDTESVAMWQQVLDRNAQLKDEAFFSENLSFDGGIKYEYSKATETESTVSYNWEATLNQEFAVSAGINVSGSGINSEYKYAMSTTLGGSSSSSEETTNTIGYQLKDNDVGDNFTIDVLEDRVYGVPVFNLSSGQSTCPHEPGTQHLDEVTIFVEESVQANVPETEAAVFKLNLGNASPGGGVRSYALSVDHASNPDGAVVKINGQAVEGLLYSIPFGESIPVTITVEKGPTAYDYEDLKILFYSECERERAEALGIPTDSLFEKSVSISAYFIESCSDVEITSPQADWVVTPSANDLLQITFDSYDLTDTDLQLVRLQYRPIGGDGSWINITEVPKIDLGPVYEVVTWDVSALSDGPFEIRAITQCQGGLPAGISTVIPGKLEREPPELLGSPQPSDGILNTADQIYIEFSEEIDCSNLTSLPGATENFVGLFNTETNQPIDIDITCSGNRIYLVPNIQNTFIENKILRAEVAGIKDLAGNAIPEPITWEFYVDRNPLKWVGGDIEEVKYEEESWSITRTIQNTGGQTEVFTLENVPAWITPSATTGEVAPGASKIIVFTVADEIASGRYKDTLQMSNPMGVEPLGLDLAVLCHPPIWEIDPAAFEYNMSLTVELNIEGTISTDEFDLVAAFVDGNLQGLAQVEYVAALDKYIAFLTVFHNDIINGEVNFQIWDASACLLYGSVLETYSFVNGGTQGIPQNPETLHTQNIVLREIPVTNGWNWISFNLDMPDKSVNTVLESLDFPENATIKGESSFSQYSTALGMWFGSMTQLGYTSMYKYKGTTNDTITLLGHPIDADTVSIPIQAGWNWIGYIPQQGASVDDALSSLNPFLLNGDIIKGRSTFAQYVAGVGWIGSLNYLEAPNGYLLKSANGGILQPFQSDAPMFLSPAANQRNNTIANFRSSNWDVNPADFEHSMTMVLIVERDSMAMLGDGDEVAAFVGEEVRGVSTPLYIEPLDAYLLFLTVHANDEGETIEFQYFEKATETIHHLKENVVFEINANVGMVDDPTVLTIAELSTMTNTLDNTFDLKVHPNPFTEFTNISFTLPKAEVITITVVDVIGNVVRKQQVDLTAGTHRFELQASAGMGGVMLEKGMYIVTLKGDAGQVSEKVLLAK